MRKFLLAATFALPFTVLSVSTASAGCCNSPPPPVHKIGISIGICWKTWYGLDCCSGHGGGDCCHQPPSCCGCSPIGCGYGPVPAGPGAGPGPGGSVPCGPWYTYYPYNAHFQTPAPTGYPNWPAPQTSGPSPLFGGNYYQAPPQNGLSNYPSPVQPCGYYQAPSYWYGQ
jgi:hypothetical protein